MWRPDYGTRYFSFDGDDDSDGDGDGDGREGGDSMSRSRRQSRGRNLWLEAIRQGLLMFLFMVAFVVILIFLGQEPITVVP